jgi:flagellar basal-body rod modification protein FlgD
MSNLQLYQASMNNAQAVDLIGKTVKAPGNSFPVRDGVSNDMHFQLAADAHVVFVNVYGPDGSVVKTMDVGPLSAGDQTLSWDSTDQEGKQMPDGVYGFEVLALDAGEAVVDATTFATGPVTAVKYENGTARLMVEGVEIPMSSVVQVMETENETPNMPDESYL